MGENVRRSYRSKRVMILYVEAQPLHCMRYLRLTAEFTPALFSSRKEKKFNKKIVIDNDRGEKQNIQRSYKPTAYLWVKKESGKILTNTAINC